MCRTHEEHVVYSGCRLLKASSKTYTLYIFPASDAEPCDPHLVKLCIIYACQDARQDIPNGTCENVTRFMPEDKIKKIGISEYEEACPVCDAADKAAVQTIYHAHSTPAAEAAPAPIPPQVGDSGQETAGDAKASRPQHRKRRHGDHKNKRRESRR